MNRVGTAAAVASLIVLATGCSSPAAVGNGGASATSVETAAGSMKSTNASASSPSDPASDSSGKARAKATTTKAGAKPETEPKTGEASGPTSSKDSKETTKKTSDPVAKLPLNKRGNLQEAVGKAAEFEDLEDGTSFADMTAEDITTNFKCTAKNSQPSVNGQFVAIRFAVEADPDLGDSGFPELAMSVHEFSAWDAAGKRVVDPVGTSETCIGPKERLTTPLDPGETSDGLVVLDVPKGKGSAAFILGAFQGSYGWEWKW